MNAHKVAKYSSTLSSSVLPREGLLPNLNLTLISFNTYLLVPDMSRVWFQWLIYTPPPKCLFTAPQSQHAGNLTVDLIYSSVE